MVKARILFFVLLLGFTPHAKANVTVLLEEPYSYDGGFAGIGHTAIYLTQICAASLTTVRRCGYEEHGVVVSRYTGIAGYDWIAMPLVPYLYAVQDPEDIPLYADPKLVAFLRDQYRRAFMQEIVPDALGGKTPKGIWVQLVGSAYDRTTYGFEFETSAEQDDALIAWLNSRPNHTAYRAVYRNCADFVNEIFEFYYPKSVARTAFTDLGISTPKHSAKSVERYSKRHRDLKFTHFVIPQVPGTVKRSGPARGVLEAAFRGKKYIAIAAAFHPVIGGALLSIDLIGERFHPERNSFVFKLSGEPEAPPAAIERRIYQESLSGVSANGPGGGHGVGKKNWEQFLKKAQPDFDADGQPVLRAPGNEFVKLGVTRGNLETAGGPLELQRELLISRMKQTLTAGRAPRISGSELQEDWKLLEKIDENNQRAISEKFNLGN